MNQIFSFVRLGVREGVLLYQDVKLDLRESTKPVLRDMQSKMCYLWMMVSENLNSTSVFPENSLVRLYVKLLTSQYESVGPLVKNLNTLQIFWDLESLGIHRLERTTYDEFADTFTFQDDRYKVSLPWKDFHESLPDHYQISHHKLLGLLCWLRQDPSIVWEYEAIIQDQLKKSMYYLTCYRDSTYFIICHTTLTSTLTKATTKLHVIYDASVKSSGNSLKDCLHAYRTQI